MEMLEEQTHTEEEMPESAGIDDDAQGGAPLLDSTEGQPDRVGSGISEVDIDDGAQNMEVLAPPKFKYGRPAFAPGGVGMFII